MSIHCEIRAFAGALIHLCMRSVSKVRETPPNVFHSDVLNPNRPVFKSLFCCQRPSLSLPDLQALWRCFDKARASANPWFGEATLEDQPSPCRGLSHLSHLALETARMDTGLSPQKPLGKSAFSVSCLGDRKRATQTSTEIEIARALSRQSGRAPDVPRMVMEV